MTFSSIEEALTDLVKGKPVIVMDSPDRENEGDVYIPAQRITPEIVGFMRTKATGLVTAPIDKSIAQKLGFTPMTNALCKGCNFTVSIDHKKAGSGISDYDRSLTIQALADSSSKPDDFVHAGHVFPIMAHPKGLDARQGHTEASIALAKLANCYPAGALCEIVRPDGEMGRLDYIAEFSKEHGMKVITIDDLRLYLKKNS